MIAFSDSRAFDAVDDDATSVDAMDLASSFLLSVGVEEVRD